MGQDSKIIDISAQFVHQTEKGFCVKNLKDKPTWLPKSQIEIEGENHMSGDSVQFQIPEWLAIDKELI